MTNPLSDQQQHGREALDLIFRDPKVLHGLADFFDLQDPVEKILQISMRGDTGDSDDARYYVRCVKRERDIQIWSKSKSSPEEIVRQLWLYRLVSQYGYRLSDIAVEHRVSFGTDMSQKPADIIVYDSDGVTPKIVIECKRPKRSDGLAQLKSYLNAEGSPVGCWSNGNDRILLYRPYPKNFDDTLTDLPKRNQSPNDVLLSTLTLDDLRTGFDFKGIVQNLEELVLANAGVDEFNEIFKIIFAKLFDEKSAASSLSPRRPLKFRKSIDEKDTARSISDLFENAKGEWPGIFEDSEELKLTPGHLQVVVGPLERVRLLGANIRVVDDAFEYLMPNVAKKKNGQFFTPRYVIDMCVKMLDPKADEYVLDPACGSAGFLVHTMDHVLPPSDSVSDSRRKEYAGEFLWGFDFDERSAKVARALMLIAGDGSSRIFRASSLDPREWFTTPEGTELRSSLARAGLLSRSVPRSRHLETREAWDYYRETRFNVILTNPPFAGEIRDSSLLREYAIAEAALSRPSPKEERDVLFVERCIDLLRAGGRAAIILPQGKFNNLTLGYVRDFVLARARVLAVVGLHPNTFQPHTGTKTSVLVLQKFSDEEIAEREEAQAKIRHSVPDYASQLRELSVKLSSDSYSEVDLPDEVVEKLAEEFGSADTSDELEPVDGGEAAEGDAIATELARAEAKLATVEQELAAKQEAGRSTRAAVNAVNRERRAYEATRRADLRRSVSGQLQILSETPAAITSLEQKFILAQISERFDYEIFMAVSENGGKASSGKYHYRIDPRTGSIQTDREGNWLVSQDCVAYLPDDKDGIAERFNTWRIERGVVF